MTVSGIDDLDNTKGGEGVEQGKVIPPSELGSLSLRESASLITGGSGTTIVVCLLKINI